MTAPSPLPAPAQGSVTVRRDAGLYGYERALRRAGLDPIAGVDEAGRGACAGPLVAGAVVLPPGKAGIVPGLADSKLLTEAARERVYAQVVRRALAWSVVVIESEECDRLGMHVANLEALRRAVARLGTRPSYVLTDGFPVDGLGVPGLAVWKGDRVAACIAAASVIAKVTRDRLMVEMHDDVAALRLPRPTRATAPPTTTRRSPSTARAPSTGCASSTCDAPRGSSRWSDGCGH